jgi:hypothetical protein
MKEGTNDLHSNRCGGELILHRFKGSKILLNGGGQGASWLAASAGAKVLHNMRKSKRF